MPRQKWSLLLLLVVFVAGVLYWYSSPRDREQEERESSYVPPTELEDSDSPLGPLPIDAPEQVRLPDGAQTSQATARREPTADSDAASLEKASASSGSTPASTPGSRASSWEEVLQVANDVLQSMRGSIRDYQGTLISHERVKGQLQPESKMQVKVLNPSPEEGRGLNVYLKFLSEQNKGREVIWSEDHPKSHMLVHEAGLMSYLGTLELDPKGRLAMRGQKYPITEIGLLRLAEKLIEKGENEARNSQAQVKIIENQWVGDRSCRLYQVTNPLDDGSSDFHIAQVFVDTERNIPLRYAAYLWPDPGAAPPLEEEYTYLNLEINTGLTLDDFDPENPNYSFP